MDPVVIETARFILRSLTTADATERYSRWFEDSAVTEHIMAAKATHDVEALRRYIAEKSATPNVLFLGIFERDRGVHIGNLKFEPIDPASSNAILGIMIGDPNWRGRGTAGEVIDAAGNWLHEKLGITELALGVNQQNVSAQRAYLKAGFVFETRPYLQTVSPETQTMVKRLGTQGS